MSKDCRDQAIIEAEQQAYAEGLTEGERRGREAAASKLLEKHPREFIHGGRRAISLTDAWEAVQNSGSPDAIDSLDVLARIERETTGERPNCGASAGEFHDVSCGGKR